MEIKEEDRWLEILPHPTRILVVGRSGSGKSATAHRLAELLSRSMGLRIYVYGVDPQRQSLFPPQIRHVGRNQSIPENAILMIDEAAMLGPARRAMKTENLELTNLAYSARQRKLTTIIVTQAGSEVDRILVESAEVIVVKRPRPYQSETDRTHLRPLLKAAEEAFSRLDSAEDPRGCAYVEHPGGREMVRIALASWWTDDLSNTLSDSVLRKVHPRKLPREQRERRARDLKALGWSFSQIARELKVSKTTAWTDVRGKPKRLTPREAAEEKVTQIGGERLPLHLSSWQQETLMFNAKLGPQEWAAALRRGRMGRIFIGNAGTLSEVLSGSQEASLAGFATSREIGSSEMRQWLERCASGTTWPGVKVEVLARPNILKLRVWPAGSHWYAENLDKTRVDYAWLERLGRQRPTVELITPTPVDIQPDGKIEVSADTTRLCSRHERHCWPRIEWLFGGDPSQNVINPAHRRALAINKTLEHLLASSDIRPS